MSSERPQQPQPTQRASDRAGCEGDGVLLVSFDGRSSAVLRIEARYPLKLLHAIDRRSSQPPPQPATLPLLPSHLPPVVQMLGYGGGLLSADRLSLSARLTSHAALLLTSPAHGRAYKQQPEPAQPAASASGCRVGSSEVHYTFQLGPSSLLLFAPFPVALFARSSLASRTTVRLHASASLLLVDVLTGGRHTRGEQFGHSQQSATTTLHFDHADPLVPAMRDRAVLAGGRHDDAAMAGRYRARGTVLLVGPLLLPLAVRLFLSHNQRTVRGTAARSASAAEEPTQCVVSAAWVCGTAPDLLPADCPVDDEAVKRCLTSERLIGGGCLLRVLSLEVESLLRTVGSLLAALDWHMQGVAPWQRV